MADPRVPPDPCGTSLCTFRAWDLAPDRRPWPSPLLLLTLSFSNSDPPTSSPAQSLLSLAGLLSLLASSHGLSFTSVPQKLPLLVTFPRVLSFARRSLPPPILYLKKGGRGKGPGRRVSEGTLNLREMYSSFPHQRQPFANCFHKLVWLLEFCFVLFFSKLWPKLNFRSEIKRSLTFGGKQGHVVWLMLLNSKN